MKKLFAAVAITAAIAFAPAAAWAEDTETDETAVAYGVEAESGIAANDEDVVVLEDGTELEAVEDGEPVALEDGEPLAAEEGGEVTDDMLRTTAMPLETPAESGAPVGLFAAIAAAAAGAVVWFKRKSNANNA